MSNASGLIVSNAAGNLLNITGELLFGTGTATLNTGNNIVLKSTASNTARVGQLASGNVITGDVMVERYLLNGRKWRLLSAPTNDATQSIRSTWQENGVLPGPAGYGFLAADTRTDFAARGFDAKGNNTSVKIYNGATDIWDPVDYTTTPIKNNQGYIVFVPGDRNVVFPASGATTFRTKGKLYTGTQPTINITANQFAVIGNPYASRIDLRNINSTNLDNAIYVWDPSLGSFYGLGAFNTFYKDIDGNYKNLVPSTIYGGFNSVNNNIESGLAFIVRGNSSGGILTFDEGDKTAGSMVASFTSGDPQGLRLNLHLAAQNGNPSVLLDGAMANFDDSYTNEIDRNDIKKMSTIGEGVAWKTGNQTIVVDRRFTVSDKDTLFIDMTKLRVQNYQWELILNNMDFPGREAFLIDGYNQTITPLNMAGTTLVNFNVQNIAGSYAADRFKIVFKQLAVVPVSFVSVQASRNANRSIAVKWKVANETNIKLYEVQRSADGVNFTGILTLAATGNTGADARYADNDLSPLSQDNFYRIMALSTSGQKQYSDIVKVSDDVKKPFVLSVYPNPVTNRQVNIKMEGATPGNYRIELIDANGERVFSKNIPVDYPISNQSLRITGALAAGRYHLIISGPAGLVGNTILFIE